MATGAKEQGSDGRLQAAQRRLGRLLLRCWLGASAFYVVIACIMSVAPIRSAVAQAHHPATPPVHQSERLNGPLPDGPESPAFMIGKAVARQTALTLAPPFLVLWFGWDVWFAVTGFLQPRARTRLPED
jgi:hypothetical protein